MADALLHFGNFNAGEDRRNPVLQRLLFKVAKGKHWPMRWSGPFNSRNGNHRNGDNGDAHCTNGHNGNGHRPAGVTGNACPDFLCVGAQKAGTSWVYRQVRRN